MNEKSEWVPVVEEDVNQGWHGFDLDGTLAIYDKWVGPDVIGEPIPKMVNLLKKYLAEGKKCKIVTARIWPIGTSESIAPCNRNRLADAAIAFKAIQIWCKEYIGQYLPVTCSKNYSMVELFDDRATQVIANTGNILEELYQKLEEENFELRSEVAYLRELHSFDD